jgi:tetratricopeptide (TPR) repeat protein
VASGEYSRGEFSTAFLEGRYQKALDLVEKELTLAPRDPMKLLYRGSCLAMLRRFEEAVESFRMADVSSHAGFQDRTGLYLRATSLFNVKAYVRAQQVLDSLSRSFPRSRLAEQGQELALKIDKRLTEGITKANLNWYLDRGTKAYDSGRPALAAEYLEEYFLLAARSGHENDASPRAHLSLGGANLELGDATAALTCLQKVSPDSSEWRAGILTAFALKASGSHEAALEMMRTVSKNADTESVQARAGRYVKQWTSQ